MNEPCTRCPSFVARCGHLEDTVIRMSHQARWWLVWQITEGAVGYSRDSATRAEADAEFERREEALLA